MLLLRVLLLNLALILTESVTPGEVLVIPGNPTNSSQSIASNTGDDVAGCICTLNFDPICASNGQTFGNACALGCERRKNPYIFGLCKGECPCCKEPFYNDPIAHIEQTGFYGWDRMSFTGDPLPTPMHKPIKPQIRENPSQESNSARVPVTTNLNVCQLGRVLVPNCPCNRIYAPLCGSDGITYGNSCELACQQRARPCLTQACRGECPCCDCRDKNSTTPCRN